MRHPIAAVAPAALALSVATTAIGTGGPAVAAWDEPELDRWFYPFNATPGTRAQMSSFGATGTPDFDDRDAQVFLRWDTAGQVTPGLGPDGYDIVSIRVTITNAIEDTVVYDDTADLFNEYLPIDDPEFIEGDAGSPMELFGVAGRNGSDPLTFTESGPFSAGEFIGTELRNLFSITLDPDGTAVPVDNGVRDRFSPAPWAIGRVDGVKPGTLLPGDDVFVFDVDLSIPGVHDYFAGQLDAGKLALLLSTHQRVVMQGGEFLQFYAKESVQAQLDLVDAATLEIVWQPADPTPCPADFDGDGAVAFGDLLGLLSAFGACDACPEDLDGDGAVAFADLLTLLAAFGPCPE